MDMGILAEFVEDGLLNRVEVVALKDVIILLSVMAVNKARILIPSRAGSAIPTSSNVKTTPSSRSSSVYSRTEPGRSSVRRSAPR
jgi:hypothetical protein